MMPAAAGSPQAPLGGLNALVVEDEAIISFLIEDMLRDLGCVEVWHAGSIRDAFARLDTHRPDVALLDVNLGGEPVFPVAERLDDAGIPFVFATGYGQRGLPPAWAPKPVIQKPFDLDVLGEKLRLALRGQDGGRGDRPG
jgi:CheY-like chemotaxis protein